MENKRYFIVFYTWLLNGELNGNKGPGMINLTTKNGDFLNRKEAIELIKAQNEEHFNEYKVQGYKFTVQICITNILEVNKHDYDVWCL